MKTGLEPAPKHRVPQKMGNIQYVGGMNEPLSQIYREPSRW
jgi:hypothetical protein